MKKPEKNPTKEVVHNANPSDARSGKHARSGQDSKPRQQARGERDASENSTGRRSVRKELADIRAEMEKEAKESKNKPSRENRTVNHKHTQKKKKSKER